jgi:ribosome-binding protein aMBF1 (putative translation factor)
MQDWEPIILKKPKPEDNKKGPSGAPPKILRDDIESFNTKHVTKDIAHRITQGRIRLKLTQDQLANKLNLRPNIVKDIEACKGPYDSIAINKLLNFINSHKD